MLRAMRSNFSRFRRSKHRGRHYPSRVVDRVCVAKRQSMGKKFDRVGTAYNDDETVTVLLSDIITITDYVVMNSYLRVGTQIRHMKLGTPMGGQTSAQLAQGTAKYLEHRVDDSMLHPERNISLAFMDDSHLRVLYYTDVDEHHPWSRSSANKYIEQLKRGYCDGLSLK